MGNGRPGMSQADGMYESSSTVNKQSFFQFRAQSGGVPESDISVRVTCKNLDSFLLLCQFVFGAFTVG